MGVRHFFKFDGVDGESTHKDHKGEIEVLSWSWGLSATSAAGKGGKGGGKGKVRPHDFTFTHLYDKASPSLLKLAAGGRHIKQVVLSTARDGSKQKDFLKVTMKEVRIASIEQVADEAGGVSEQVGLTATDIAFEYRPLKADGSSGGPVTVDWNIADGKVT